jgi:SecD/SecF fusion protein
MKSYLTKIILCLVPVIASCIVVGWAFDKYRKGQGGIRLGVDLAGGTILVYEVDPTKQTQDQYKPEELANALKRRIDPADLYNVTIRPIAGNPPRVEIILPTGGRQQQIAQEAAWKDLLAQVNEKYPPPKGKTYSDIPQGQKHMVLELAYAGNPDVDQGAISSFVDNAYKGTAQSLTTERIEEIKNLIQQQGRLEFVILANTEDDRDAIDRARTYVSAPSSQDDLKRRAYLGDPPPPPKNEDGGLFFPVTINGESKSYSYRWVLLGKEELYNLKLENKSEHSEGFVKSRWDRVAAAREKGEAILMEEAGGALLYSRTIPNPERLNPKDRELGKKYEYYILVREPEKGMEITGDYLASATSGVNQRGEPAVHFRLKPEGATRFHELTLLNKKSNIYRHLAIVLDAQIRSAPRLNEPISHSGEISGGFQQKEVQTLVTILRAGALPATLKQKPVSENTMGPTLGEDTIRKGTTAVGLAFLAVMIFMVIYYRFSGTVACIALMANLVMTVAFMVLVKATFTLPGLAGLVLMLGMAVDANVLIYERLREERERGASLALAIRNGYDRAFPTIIDTHLSSIFTAIVLYVVGNDQLKGFGISLTVGLIISLFTSLYMTRLMFDMCLSRGWLHKLSMMQLFHRPNIDFMGIRYYWFTATVILTILGAGLFIYRLDRGGLNIDFVGGTAYTGMLTKPMGIGELRETLEKDSNLPDLSIEPVYTSADTGDTSSAFTVRTSLRDQEVVQQEISRRLGDNLKRITLESFEIDRDNSRATLHFTSSSGGKDYASPAQVMRLLREQTGGDLQVRVEPAPGADNREGRYDILRIELGEAMNRTRFNKILASLQQQFKDNPQPERLEVFDSQLAKDTQERALYAILASWGAILLFLWFRFGSWTFGLAAVFCLIHDLFFTLGIIAACHYLHGTWLGNALALKDFKIDFAAIAALLTLVGYSVSDTIVVFDRIREVRGKNPLLTSQMINDSVNQTLSRTVLSSLTVWVVVIVLYMFGGEGVHLFGFVMIVGVIVGTYSSIYIASPLLLMFGEGSPAQRDRLARPTTAGVQQG